MEAEEEAVEAEVAESGVVEAVAEAEAVEAEVGPGSRSEPKAILLESADHVGAVSLPGFARQVHLTGAVGIHREDLRVSPTPPKRPERDRGAVRAPGGSAVGSRIVGQRHLVAPVGVHDVDVPVAVPLAGEGDLRPDPATTKAKRR